jgi:hypothetical protein
MIPLCLTNTPGIYTLKLVFSILSDHWLGLPSATSAVYTVRMDRSADQSLVQESGLIDDRDYDTEDADTQSTTDDEGDTLPLGRSLGAGQLPRVRNLSPSGGRTGSSRILTVAGAARNFGSVPLCLIAGCSFEARVSEGHDFCSRTCSRLVRIWLAVLYSQCLNLSLLVCHQRLDGREFGTSRPEIVAAKCLNPACGRMNRSAEGHPFCGLRWISL